MCGIAGFVGSCSLSQGTLEHCLGLMRRRGPDAAAFSEHFSPPDRHVYLLHSRLSIIDLDERANQPFRQGQARLVFNGEIYNYLELRRELEAAGEAFATSSDTEVLLRGLLLEREAFLSRCEGMFALALYDEADGSLLLARDRFGEKPLYMLRDERGLWFGSEAKFIFALSGRRPALNLRHLRRYLVNGYKSLYKTRDCFFEGLTELPRATALRLLPNGREETSSTWRPCFSPDESMTYDQAVQRTRQAMLDTVKLRLRADVPMAFCLSGGIDSNSLIGVAKKVYGYDVHGFTIVNADARYEEWDMVEHAIRSFGIRHTAIPVRTEGFLPGLRELVRQHDAPVYTITYYANWLLMQSVAEQGYRIVVSGIGADELFSGYFDHHLAYLREVAGDPELYAASLQAWQERIQPFVRNPFLKNPRLFQDDSGFRGHIYLDAPDFAAYLKDDFQEDFFEERYCDDLLRNRMLNELFHESIPVILHEDDLNAMYHSIENRSPYLDTRLFETAAAIPTRLLVQRGLAKAVLRDSMRGIVPDVILDNPRKVGFNAPIHSFLDVHDPDVRAELLGASPIFELIKRDKIETLLDRTNLPNSVSKFLFHFVNAKIFLEEFGQ